MTSLLKFISRPNTGEVTLTTHAGTRTLKRLDGTPMTAGDLIPGRTYRLLDDNRLDQRTRAERRKDRSNR